MELLSTRPRFKSEVVSWNWREESNNLIIIKSCLFSYRTGKRYNATLHLNGSDHGLTLELGAYVAKIQPGSVAAKEGSIAVGDRIVCVSVQRQAE
jgi:hypothetical protein